MYRAKRDDTLVHTIENQYGIELHARSDMKLGNLLTERGFDSLSQLLDAYYGRLSSHARKRHLFLSFHREDLLQVTGFRLMAQNPNVDVDFYDDSVREPVGSMKGSYVRSVIREKIRRSSVVVCLIGNGTAWRDWVDWELQTAIELGKGLCGVRLKEARGRTPPAIGNGRFVIAGWDVSGIVAAIEQAAARRS